ncbi:MAG: TetR/AcrR family transcriptional regulator [Alphaproteobacteria bacterium]|nr:TetR/AcrR family transcriptional regulator [Alphaproteobacteria bacterium]
MATSERREHLIDTAIQLFAEHGFHATGIDTILKSSGVSKKTLYRHFRSKEELILAALRKYDGLFRNSFMRQVEELADTPRGRLLAVFDVAEIWFGQSRFFGCMFINAIGEYSDIDTPIRQACMEFKALMRGYFRELCMQAEIPGGALLSEELALLFEGATVTAQVSRDRGHAARIAKIAAEALIDRAVSAAPGPK